MTIRTPALGVALAVDWPRRGMFSLTRAWSWIARPNPPVPPLAEMASWEFGRKGRASAPVQADGKAALSRFEDLVLPHLDAAYTLAVYLCRDRDAAEDVVQDACLRAFRGFDGFRGDNAKAWLLAIVRNCHLSWREELRRRSSVVDGSAASKCQGESGASAGGTEAPAGEDDPEAVLVRRDEAERVRAVLAELPEPAREILVLREIEDLPYRDIAQVLDLPLGTVMSRLARAKKAFALRWRVRRPDGERA